MPFERMAIIRIKMNLYLISLSEKAKYHHSDLTQAHLSLSHPTKGLDSRILLVLEHKRATYKRTREVLTVFIEVTWMIRALTSSPCQTDRFDTKNPSVRCFPPAA